MGCTEILTNIDHSQRFPVIKIEIWGVFRPKIVKIKFESAGHPTSSLFSRKIPLFGAYREPYICSVYGEVDCIRL